jgi:hypothetical protein
MLKIVISKKHGGFGLSAAAILYLLSKGSDLIVTQTFEYINFDPRQEDLSQMKPTSHERCYSNWAGTVFDIVNQVVYFTRHLDGDGNLIVYSKEFRTHPDLIEVVEQMGDAASGPYAHLKLVTIDDPKITFDDIEICDNAGCETIHEKHRIWE